MKTMKFLGATAFVALLAISSCKKSDSSPSGTGNNLTLGQMVCKVDGVSWQSGLANPTVMSATATANYSTDYGTLMNIVGQRFNSATGFTEEITLYTTHWLSANGVYKIKFVTNNFIQATPVSYFKTATGTYNSDGADSTSEFTVTDYDAANKTFKGSFHFSARTTSHVLTNITEGSFYVKSNY